MAKVNISKLLEMLSGKMGGTMFRRMPDGSIVVSGVPTYKKGRGTPAQKEYWDTFADRAQWAKFAYKHYPIYEELAANLPMITAYNMALKDISHPPVVHRILREEGWVLVQASDEVMVEKVRVEVWDEAGRRLERVEAVRLEGDWWECAVKCQGVKITATAWDIPGNIGQLEVE